MKSIDLKTLLLGGSLLAGTFAYSTIGYAQETPVVTEDDVIEIVEEEETEGKKDQVIVTGSRIKRDTFSSISPLQVISTELAQDVGLIDPSSILQRSEAASGQQIDATFQGFVLDNGPGSQTLNLRGLGAGRTLLLLNGRRMAPAGVEGAPTSPSINLLPGSLIERYDLLLDGASSVYGSDAVAGVANVVLKKDFEGLELFGSGNLNPSGGGDDYTVSGSWGKNSDRGFIGLGAEYDFRDEVKLGDRDFLEGCDTHYEITSDGDIRTLGIRDRLTVENRTPGVTVSDNDCKIGGISGRIFSGYQSYGSIYYTDGPGNSGITGFNESTIGGVDIDGDGDGIRDVDFQNVNTNGALPETTFISQQERISLMAFGEYTMDGPANITPFFEALYVDAKIEAPFTGAPQVFPYVPGSNPFNPCNLANNDCAAAEVTLLGRPGVNAGFSLPVIPIFSIKGDRSNFEVEQEQVRLVGGFKGDVPFLSEVGSLNNWTFETSFVYSRAKGKSTTRGIREDKLAFALGIDPSADFDRDGIVDNNNDGYADDYDQNVAFPSTTGGACNAAGLRNPDLLLADVTQGCVPVDLFNGSVLGSAVGDFATQAERDYLFGERLFDTVYEQKVVNGFITGNVMELPAGDLGAVLGFEYREDFIDSSPNAEAANGLFFGYSADQGAVGGKHIFEMFAEADIPLVADKPFFEQLDLNVSGRYTDEEIYGSAWTYSIKGGWRPVDSLLLKASFGTSFRAPNLRENFLLNQTGFRTLSDPCAVPNAALDAGGLYDASLETRDPVVLANCSREGRDPTSVGIDPLFGNTITSASAEISTGGTLDITAETSESFTVGFAFDQPFTDAFDLNLNVNYYDIKIEGAIVEPSSQFIVNDCYARQDGTRSVFCDRITVDSPAVSPRALIGAVASGFINQDEETVKGIDINVVASKEITAFDKIFDLGLNVRANKLLERNNLFVDDNGNQNLDEDAGEFGFPEWTGTATVSLDWDKLRLTWQARYIGDVEQAATGIDPLDDAYGSLGTGFFGDTCAGPTAGDVTCRDVGFADDYLIHTVAVRYEADTWTVRAGVSNLFDKAPPLVDSNEVFAVSNTPIGNGYDLDGREFFASVSKKF